MILLRELVDLTGGVPQSITNVTSHLFPMTMHSAGHLARLLFRLKSLVTAAYRSSWLPAFVLVTGERGAELEVEFKNALVACLAG